MFNVANSISGLPMRIQVRPWVSTMEEPEEQDTVVFALIVTEPASECVCGGGGGGLHYTHPPTTSHFRNNSCKDDSALFSRFLHGFSLI